MKDTKKNLFHFMAEEAVPQLIQRAGEPHPRRPGAGRGPGANPVITVRPPGIPAFAGMTAQGIILWISRRRRRGIP